MSLSRILTLVGLKKKTDFSITATIRMRQRVEKQLDELEASLPDEDLYFLKEYPTRHKENSACGIPRPHKASAE